MAIDKDWAVPVTEAALGAAAKAIIGYLAKEGIAAVAPADRVRSLLDREPEQIAFKVALAGAVGRLERQHPELKHVLFDEHLMTHRAAPTLARALSPIDRPQARELAEAWAHGLGWPPDDPHVDYYEPPAEEFLTWWRKELRSRPEFAPLFDGRALDAIAEASERTAGSVEALRSELDQALLALRYPALDEHVDWASCRRIRELSASVAGREWLLDELEELAGHRSRGYVHSRRRGRPRQDRRGGRHCSQARRSGLPLGRPRRPHARG